MLAQVLSTAPPPTLECLLGMVLPAVITRISSRSVAGTVSTSRETGSSNTLSTNNNRTSRTNGSRTVNGTSGRGNNRDTAAVHTICRLAASVAVSSTITREGAGDGGPDPVQFRDKVSGSELRKLGPLGMEAEVALAEAFFYREAGGGAMF